jgi:hypothetical protein
VAKQPVDALSFTTDRLSTRAKDKEMTRKTLQRLLLVLVAILSLGAMAEAAGPKRVVHRRPKHSTRVASGVRTPKKKPTLTAKSRTAVTSRTLPTKRKPTTKPH